MYLLVDLGETGPELAPVWERSGFWERLAILPAEGLILFDARGRHWPGTPGRAHGDLREALRAHGVPDDAVLCWIDGRQVFLLPECVETARKRGPEVDYFTQWEHCRLPVGLGVRTFRPRSLRESGARTPEAHFAFVRSHPGRFRIHHDETPWTGAEAATLDLRYAEPLAPFVGTPARTLLRLAAAGTRALPRYAPEAAAPRTDERRMPAAWGFETPEGGEFPNYLMFDITNKCNAKCVHCPQSTLYADNDHRPGHLDFAIFRKAIDECRGRRLQLVRITADGEPLIHRHLFDMVEYAVAADVGPVALTTNGSLLTREKAERLVRAGLFMVDVSLDALHRETFERIRVGLDYDRTQASVQHLLDARDALAAPLRVMVSFVEQEANRAERDAFVAHWEGRVDKVLVRELTSNVNTVEVSNATRPSRRWPCPHWFRRVVVNFDGSLKACPIDWKGESIYRHLSETTIAEAWQSAFYRDHRLQHLNDRIDCGSLCFSCEDWKTTPWEMGYEKVVGQLGRARGRRTRLPAPAGPPTP